MSDLNRLVIDSKMADFVLRTRQAEEIASKFLLSAPSHAELVNTIQQHITERSADRAIHLEAVLRATEAALNVLYQRINDTESSDAQTSCLNEVEEGIVNIIKAVSTALN